MRDVSRAAKSSDVSIRPGIGKGDGTDNDIASLVREVGDAIWCTNVNLDVITHQFWDFLENFTDDNILFIYPELIDDAIESQKWCNILYANRRVSFDTCVNDYR